MPAFSRVAKSVFHRALEAKQRALGTLARVFYAPLGSIGRGLAIDSGVRLDVYGTLRIGDNVRLSAGCLLSVGPQGTLIIGDHVFIGRNSVIVASDRVTIGDGTDVAEHCTIRDGEHALEVSERRDGAAFTSPVTLGRGCWLGAGARVLKGSGLGDGVVVGANAVVRGTFPSDVIIAGVPARIIRSLKDGATSTG